MKDVQPSKKLTKKTPRQITRMSRKATQTITAIQSANTLTQASKMLGISRSALYERIKRYELQPIIQSLKDQAETTLVMATPEIVEDRVAIAKGEKKVSKLQDKAQMDLLDRAGITKKESPKQAIGIQATDMSIEFIET